ncbi:MAG: hypothetical protein Q4F49_01175 [Pseudoxanthomonas suwonensis]|nr:hypothetical protein [Pseudoxanthomonas suwonensis]
MHTCPNCWATIDNSALRFDLDAPVDASGQPPVVMRCPQCRQRWRQAVIPQRRILAWACLVLCTLAIWFLPDALPLTRGPATIVSLLVGVAILIVMLSLSRHSIHLHPVDDTRTDNPQND